MRRVLGSIFFALMLAAATSARCGSPAGIVMAITGKTEPPVEVMAEILANSPIRLLGTAELTFLHYSRCKLVTVEGGTLSLTRRGYSEDGRVESETDGPCPRIYSVQGAGSKGWSSGGIVARGLDTSLRWPAGSEIIFTGSRPVTVVEAEIIADEQAAGSPVQLDVVSGRGRQPQGTAPLQPERRYTLRLTIRGQLEPVDVPFVAVAPTRSVSLVVLRIN